MKTLDDFLWISLRCRRHHAEIQAEMRSRSVGESPEGAFQADGIIRLPFAARKQLQVQMGDLFAVRARRCRRVQFNAILDGAQTVPNGLREDAAAVIQEVVERPCRPGLVRSNRYRKSGTGAY